MLLQTLERSSVTGALGTPLESCIGKKTVVVVVVRVANRLALLICCHVCLSGPLPTTQWHLLTIAN